MHFSCRYKKQIFVVYFHYEVYLEYKRVTDKQAMPELSLHSLAASTSLSQDLRSWKGIRVGCVTIPTWEKKGNRNSKIIHYSRYEEDVRNFLVLQNFKKHCLLSCRELVVLPFLCAWVSYFRIIYLKTTSFSLVSWIYYLIYYTKNFWAPERFNISSLQSLICIYPLSTHTHNLKNNKN